MKQRLLMGALVLMWAAWLLPIVLVLVEGGTGHDGLLCEMGIDMDGAGTGDTGCSP